MKLLFIFGLLYFAFRLFSSSSLPEKKQSPTINRPPTSKKSPLDDTGDYIDYEEINE